MPTTILALLALTVLAACEATMTTTGSGADAAEPGDAEAIITEEPLVFP